MVSIVNKLTVIHMRLIATDSAQYESIQHTLNDLAIHDPAQGKRYRNIMKHVYAY